MSLHAIFLSSGFWAVLLWVTAGVTRYWGYVAISTKIFLLAEVLFMVFALYGLMILLITLLGHRQRER